MKKQMIRAKLLKDIVISAGTIFEQAPRKTEYVSPHAEYLIAFGADSCGSLIVPIEKENADWFEPLDE